MELRHFLARQLMRANSLYQAGIEPAEIGVMAEDWAASLEEEATEYSREEIAAAFTRHSRESRRFPTPLDIIDLLPHVRTYPARSALPECAGSRVRPELAAARAEFIRDIMAGKYLGRREVQEAYAIELGLVPAGGVC